jgi:predicted outer membrane protein
MKHIVFTGAVAVMTMGLWACGGNPASPDRPLNSTAGTITTASASGGASFGLLQSDAGQPLSGSESDFVSFAEVANSAAIELGMLAERLGDLPAVKQLGSQMAQDNRNALENLRTSAPNDVSSSVSLDATHLRLRSDLSARSGSAFDRMFIPLLIEELETTVSRFQSVAGQNGGNVAVREYAAGYLPRFIAHLQMARDLLGRVQ